MTMDAQTKLKHYNHMANNIYYKTCTVRNHVENMDAALLNDPVIEEMYSKTVEELTFLLGIMRGNLQLLAIAKAAKKADEEQARKVQEENADLSENERYLAQALENRPILHCQPSSGATN